MNGVVYKQLPFSAVKVCEGRREAETLEISVFVMCVIALLETLTGKIPN